MLLIHQFNVKEGVVRLFLREYEGQYLFEIRFFKSNLKTGELEETTQGIVLPVQVLDELYSGLSKLKSEIEERKIPVTGPVPEEIYSYFCSVCKEPLRQISEGVYECDCGESRVICLPVRDAFAKLFEKIKEEHFFEEYAPG